MPATQPTIASLGATAETRLPRALRVPRAMLLALTIIYLARGEFFVIRLAERVREGAGENVESRVNSALLGLERMTDRFERMATVLAAEPAVVEAFRAAGRGADAGPSLTAAARPILETADAQGVTYLDANGHALRVSGQDSVGLATLPTLPDFLTTATAQRAAFSQVVPSAVPALDIGGRRRQGAPVHFVSGRVRDAAGRTLGAMRALVVDDVEVNVRLQATRTAW